MTSLPGTPRHTFKACVFIILEKEKAADTFTGEQSLVCSGDDTDTGSMVARFYCGT